MQEEVENRTINLAVSTTRMSAKAVAEMVLSYLRARKAKKAIGPSGKMSVKQLIRKEQGASQMELADKDLRGFERIARKYGVDYAVRKDHSKNPMRYLVFFKAKDADVLTAAMKEYMDTALRKARKPSILEKLRGMVEMMKAVPEKIRFRAQERSR